MGELTSYSYRTYTHAMLLYEFRREMEDRVIYRVDSDLETLGIPDKMCLFRDCNGPGWRRVSINPVD